MKHKIERIGIEGDGLAGTLELEFETPEEREIAGKICRAIQALRSDMTLGCYSLRAIGSCWVGEGVTHLNLVINYKYNGYHC